MSSAPSIMLPSPPSLRDIELLLQAKYDVAQRALAFDGIGSARIAAGHLPSGAHSEIVMRNDRDVDGAAALPARAQLGEHQGLELRPGPRRSWARRCCAWRAAAPGPARTPRSRALPHPAA